MVFFISVNKTFIHTLKTIALIVFLTNSNITSASSVNVNIESMGLSNWDIIAQQTPGFGSSGPVVLNWDPNNSFYTELLAWNGGYSGKGAAFCWHGEDCALELSTSEEAVKITLDSFSIGYYGFGGIVEYDVVDLKTDTSILSGVPWISGSDSSLITVNSSSEAGFRILFGPDGFNGGINDIAYSYSTIPAQSPIPIPAAFWLFSSALLGLIHYSRQSRLA